MMKIYFWHNFIFFFFMQGGGSMADGQDSYHKCDEFDVNKKSWSSISPMTVRRGTFQTDALNFRGLILVISGDDPKALGTVEAYNPFLDSWFQMPPLPKRLMFMGAAAVGDTLLATGGLDKDIGEISDSVFSLSLQLNEWVSHEARLPNARYGHSACGAWGKLLLCGGQLAPTPNNPHGYTNTVDIYDPKSSTFTVGPPMLQFRIWFQSLVINNELYLIGGDVTSAGSSIFPSIEKLSSVSGVFEQVTDFPSKRRLFSVTAVGSKIYVFGGRDESYATLTDWDIFDTELGTWGSVLNKAHQSATQQADSKAKSKKKAAVKVVSSANMTADVDVNVNWNENVNGAISSRAGMVESKGQGGNGGDDCWWRCINGNDNLVPRSSFYGGQAVAYPPPTWG